jgi:plasmid maintenance system killer protein
LNSRTRPSFWRAYEALDSSARKAARDSFALFLRNPNHPSLRFKKLGGYEQIWSVRVSEQYRAVGERRGDSIWWIWVGTHNQFDKLFS